MASTDRALHRRGDEVASPSRIRDAAVDRFGRDGFGVGLRAIASDAGVTAGLVVHHFRSKAGLRRACDEHVLSVVRAEKTKALTDQSAVTLMAQLAEVEQFAPVVRYLLRSLQAGGDLAAALIDQMTADADAYLAAGVVAGVVRPSRDPSARAVYLTYQAVGGMLLWFSLHAPVADTEAFRTRFRHYVKQVATPALELFAQGLLVDRSMLDDYLMYVPDPPAEVTAADAAQ